MQSEVKLNIPSRKFVEPRISIAELTSIIQSGPYLNGPFTNEFESKFSNYLSIRNVILVSSGTEALRLAITALNLPNNKKIGILPNCGGYAQIAAKLSNHNIKYLEINSNGLMDLDLFVKNWTQDIGAIVVTHLFGQNQDLSQIIDFCKKKNIFIIEDCAQSSGSYINSKATGGQGHISTFSFYPTKNLSTVGDAGAVATNDDNLAIKIRKLREYGWSERYDAELHLGNNSRNDEIHASVLIKQLDFLDLDIKERKDIWARYKENASEQIEFIGLDDNTYSCHLCVVRVDDQKHFRNYMSNLGIETAVHYPLLDFDQKAFKTTKDGFTKSRAWVSSIVTIPLFTKMNQTEVDQVIKALRKYGK